MDVMDFVDEMGLSRERLRVTRRLSVGSVMTAGVGLLGLAVLEAKSWLLEAGEVLMLL